ncbi:MAG: phage terminase large subunit family protein [Alphaproteobacteria bacterium]|nr:phage terminase large subunit family protein [Alphaproteobacteria bacterium]
MGARSLSKIESWARKYLAHPKGSRWPGPWKPRHPAYREVLAAFDEDDLRRAVVRGSTQAGKTELLAVLAAYYAAGEGAPVLIYSSGIALTRVLFDRLRHFYSAASHGALQRAFAPARPPNGRQIDGGGSIEVINSGATTAFQARPGRVVLLDEVRSHPASLVVAAEGRQAAWEDMKPLTIAVSSAAPMPPCRISELYDRSDARDWRVPAPCCNHEIPIIWGQVDGYALEPDKAFYRCPMCHSPISGRDLKRVVKQGRFIATKTAQDAGSVGFHIPETINPNVSLGATARKHASALTAFRNTGQGRELQDFHADALAETYADPDAVIDPEAARQQCRLPGYDPEVHLPSWVSMLTMSADVQVDRLEVEIAGFGAVEVATEGEASRFKLDRRPGWQTWQLGGRHFRLMRAGVLYKVIDGDPNTDDPWTMLNSIRAQRWRIGSTTGPEIRPGLCLVDAGGHHTERVRAWSRANGPAAAACKGASRDGQPLHRLAQTKDILAEYGKPLCFVGTDAAKDIVLGSVRRATMTGDHAWCWPDGDGSGYDWRYFAGLCSSERRMLVESKIEKRVRSRYVKQPGAANEPLDLAVYCLAGLSVMGLSRLVENARQIGATNDNRRAA